MSSVYTDSKLLEIESFFFAFLIARSIPACPLVDKFNGAELVAAGFSGLITKEWSGISAFLVIFAGAGVTTEGLDLPICKGTIIIPIVISN